MRFKLIAGLAMLPFFANSQPCALLTQTFAIADTMRKDRKELYVFRFSDKQLGEIKQLPGLEKATTAIQKLQTTLNQDRESLQKNLFWQLDEKLAQKQLEELRKECPETGFNVYRKEIEYYLSRFQVKK